MDHQDTFVSNQPAIKYPNSFYDFFGTVLLYFFRILCVVGAMASFIQNKTLLGIEALFLGFLFSPYGIPMLGASIIAFLHVVNKGIKSI